MSRLAIGMGPGSRVFIGHRLAVRVVSPGPQIVRLTFEDGDGHELLRAALVADSWVELGLINVKVKMTGHKDCRIVIEAPRNVEIVRDNAGPKRIKVDAAPEVANAAIAT